MSATLELKLFVKIDKHGQEYLIGSPDFPAEINLKDYTFIVFYPEEGSDRATLLLRPKKERRD